MRTALVQSVNCPHDLPAPRRPAHGSWLRRGSVLLLLLIFMVTGCVGCTTHYRVASHRSSSRSKQNVRSQNKTKAPAAQPATPPAGEEQPSPPQESERGGRIF